MTPSASPTPPSPETQECPACHAQVSGRFCAECGNQLAGARCLGCNTELTPGAKFCHRCGLPAGASVPATEARSWSSALPWAVAAIAFIALVALVAGQRFSGARPAAVDSLGLDPTGGAGAAGQVAPFAGAAVDPALASCASGPAPNINGMTAQEQAEHLYDRVMLFSEQGRADCVQAFMPMALAAYEGLSTLNLGAHYDIGRLGEISGDTALAGAEADTILKKDPTHLLGLFLAAHVARLRKDTSAERGFYRRFLAAEPTERAKSLPEYLAHANDISSGEGEARQLSPK